MGNRPRPAHVPGHLYAALISIFIILGIGGCSHDSSPLAPSATTSTPIVQSPTTAVAFDVTGTVSSRGDGVAGAQIDVTSGPQPTRSVVTDAEGRYTLRDLVAGTYSLRVTREGFDALATSLAVRGDRRLDFQLLPATAGRSAPEDPDALTQWHLTGTVTNSSSGAPLLDARVVVVEGANRGMDTTSGADGVYTLGPLDQGGLVLRVEAEGFGAAQESISIESDATLDFSLAAVAPPAPPGPPVTGRAVDVLSGMPIPDVRIRIDGGGEALSSADGAFSVAGTAGPTEQATLSSSSTVERQTRIQADADATLSLIPRSFDLHAFEQMVRSRGGLMRWVEAPAPVVERRVLAFTTTTDTSYTSTDTVMTESEANELVSDLAWTLPQLTGGTFAQFSSIDVQLSDEGAAVLITRPGVIVVARFEGLEAAIAAWAYGRWAWNGAGEVNAGAMMLDNGFETSGSPYRRALRAHELGHTLGYDHVTSGASVMNSSGRIEPNAFDRNATVIAFRRPPLNASPDVDPDAVTVSRAARTSLQWDGRR